MLGKAVGLQFHLESSMDSIGHLIENCGDELVDGKYIQNQEEILSHVDRVPEMNRRMALFLDTMRKSWVKIVLSILLSLRSLSEQKTRLLFLGLVF